MASVCMPSLLMLFCVLCLVPGVTSRHVAARSNGNLQGIQKVYTPIPQCSTLKPESVTMETTCLSSCGTAANDPSLVCSLQAETWKIRLAVDKKSGFSTRDDCRENTRRYKCIPYETSEIQCSDATFDTYPSGFSCFTNCGELKCPSDDFLAPKATDDFKLADCKSSYRVRCRIHPSNEYQQIGIPDLTMELQLGGRQYAAQ